MYLDMVKLRPFSVDSLTKKTGFLNYFWSFRHKREKKFFSVLLRIKVTLSSPLFFHFI